MSHLIDPCLRATKIAHGIRRGIDGISPLSGLVPELRILIQEQKNVLSSLKRTAFEKEEGTLRPNQPTLLLYLCSYSGIIVVLTYNRM